MSLELKIYFSVLILLLLFESNLVKGSKQHFLIYLLPHETLVEVLSANILQSKVANSLGVQ